MQPGLAGWGRTTPRGSSVGMSVQPIDVIGDTTGNVVLRLIPDGIADSLQVHIRALSRTYRGPWLQLDLQPWICSSCRFGNLSIVCRAATAYIEHRLLQALGSL